MKDVLKSEKGGKINFVASRAAKQYVFTQIHREKPVSPYRATESLQRSRFHGPGRDGRGH